MATVDTPQPTACDALRVVRQAARDLATWAAHLEAYLTGEQPGEALAAARAAGIVTASLTQAACDTRSIARAAADQAAA